MCTLALQTENGDARHNGVLHAGVVHHDHGCKRGQDGHTQLLRGAHQIECKLSPES